MGPGAAEPLWQKQSDLLQKGLLFTYAHKDAALTPLLAVLLLVLFLVAWTRFSAATHNHHEKVSLIHRCDFCKEAILLIDNEAKCYVRHSKGARPLLGYSVVNACGACVREQKLDDAFLPEGADPPFLS